MEKKKEEAKSVLDRMSGASDTGLLAQTIKAWWDFIVEDKKDRALADQLNAQSSKFKSLADRQKGNAAGVQTRVNDQVKINLVLKCFSGWRLECQVYRVEKYFTSKIDAKRRQLDSVKSLFKSFAVQLEQGLGNAEGESSGRTQNSRRTKKGMESSVSLPDIHQRP